MNTTSGLGVFDRPDMGLFGFGWVGVKQIWAGLDKGPLNSI